VYPPDIRKKEDKEIGIKRKDRGLRIPLKQTITKTSNSFSSKLTKSKQEYST
jgi:hypothetical protein